MKYKTTDEKMVLKFNGEEKTVYRIQALRDFGNVKKGDLGGYIETQENLSNDGTCWVGDNAVVKGNARVCDNALVGDNAVVKGNAIVYGNALIKGDALVKDNGVVGDNAWVCGTCWVCDKALVCGNALIRGNALVRGDCVVKDNCWVCDNAVVGGDAWVGGDAVIKGNARVGGDAVIGGDAWVCDNAVVYGNAWVYSKKYIHKYKSTNKKLLCFLILSIIINIFPFLIIIHSKDSFPSDSLNNYNENIIYSDFVEQETEKSSLENQVISQQDLIANSEQLDVLYLEKSKTYMDYRTITNKNSKQYKLLQELTYTDDGYIKTDDGYTAVALGSYFGNIGQKYILELTCGKILKVIKADEKSNTHTKDGYITTADGSVVEFIVDSEVMVKGSNGMPYNGNFNNNENFSGQIQTIYKIGK